MILSGKEILKRKDKDIIIEPFNKNQVNPNSYNLKLHNELMVYEKSPLDMKEDNAAQKIIIPEDGLLLESRKLYLGRTVEYTETCLLYTSPSPRDGLLSRMPSSA